LKLRDFLCIAGGLCVRHHRTLPYDIQRDISRFLFVPSSDLVSSR
jgi:hypothetical protein